MYNESEGLGSTTSVETGQRTFGRIMSKLVSIHDMSGAVIVRVDGSVISWRTKDGHKTTQEIDFINGSISATYKKNIHYWKSGMFTESILDYNGQKILSNRIREDVMLF